MRFATLGSGSAGNALIVEHGPAALLVDCGLSWRQVEQRAAALGFDLRRLCAALVSHEHDDHVAGIATLARRLDLPVHLSRGTRQAAGARLGALPAAVEFVPDCPFVLGPFAIEPVIVPHDAREPCQFVIAAGTQRLGILTDTGQTTPYLARRFCGLDGLLLEFNHDPALLAASAYPAALRARIGGPYGHLSNTQAASFLRSLDQRRLRWVMAAHLSEKTNTPETVAEHLARSVAAGVRRRVASQGAPSAWCDLGA